MRGWSAGTLGLTQVGRLDGEEFGILLVGAPREPALVIAERIRHAVAETVIEGDRAMLTVSVSLGLAFAMGEGCDLQQLCREADAALYRAKDAGRNRVETAASA